MKVATFVSTHWQKFLRQIAASLLFGLLLTAPKMAQGQLPGVNEYAESLVAGLTPHWGGPRVPHPMATPRPTETGVYLSDELESVRVHGGRIPDEARMRTVLLAANRAIAALRAREWGVVAEDGGLGGSTEFDVYLDENVDGYEVRSDGSLLWTYLDTESGFAVVDAKLSDRDLEACTTAAYAETLLMSLDPAEAVAWRRSTAAYLTYLLTGSFGCREAQVLSDVALSYQAAIPDSERVAEGRDAAAAGYFVALLDAQESTGSATFMRDMWQLTRQRTWEGHDLRASPDLWMSINATLEYGHRKLVDIVEQISVGRFLAGTRGAPNDGYRSLPHVTPRWVGTTTFAALPTRFAPADPPIETYGTGYFLLRIEEEVPANTRIRVWMHGEFRVEWDLVVVPLDREGRELSRVAAPPRRTPRSYLEVLLPARTDRVLVAVTNMSHRLPDADIPDANARSFQLIIDK